jgi:F0F1-type ATP synthase assembly protein I
MGGRWTMSAKPPQRNLLRYATVGLEFFITFGMFLWLGWLLDGWRGTSPGFTVLGALVGFSIAMWRLWRQGWGILQEGRDHHDANQHRKG